MFVRLDAQLVNTLATTAITTSPAALPRIAASGIASAGARRVRRQRVDVADHRARRGDGYDATDERGDQHDRPQLERERQDLGAATEPHPCRERRGDGL